jgi:hypothetical protein
MYLMKRKLNILMTTQFYTLKSAYMPKKLQGNYTSEGRHDFLQGGAHYTYVRKVTRLF